MDHFLDEFQYTELERIVFANVKAQLRNRLSCYRKEHNGEYQIGSQVCTGFNEYLLVLFYLGELLEDGEFYHPILVKNITGMRDQEFFAFVETLSDKEAFIAPTFIEALRLNSHAGYLGDGAWEEGAFEAFGYTVHAEDAAGNRYVKKANCKPCDAFKAKASIIADEYHGLDYEELPEGYELPPTTEVGYEPRSTLFVVTSNVEAKHVSSKYGISNERKKLIGKCMPQGFMPTGVYIDRFLCRAQKILPDLTREDAIVLLRLRKGQLLRMANGEVGHFLDSSQEKYVGN